jgi:hypothetical protein
MPTTYRPPVDHLGGGSAATMAAAAVATYRPHIEISVRAGNTTKH